MNFSFVIPTVGSIKNLATCIRTLKQYEMSTSYEIIIIDDGSNLQHKKLLTQFCSREKINKVIFNEINSGFAASVNKGINLATGDVVILCNNDIVFNKPVLAPLKRAFESDTNIGIVGALLHYPNNNVQHAGMQYLESHKSFVHLHGGKHIRDSHVNTPKYLIAVTGALFAFPKYVYETLGPFNEKYFLACEDTEYCLRAWEGGYRVFYAPTVSAIHLEGA